MRTRHTLALRGALAAALALTLAAAVHADPGDVRRGARALRKPGAFTLSAEFSGFLGGSLWIGGSEYRLARNATVYVVGRGPAPRETFLDGASVFLSGERVGRVAIVHSVIVRPARPESGGAGEAGAPVGAAPPGAPQ